MSDPAFSTDLSTGSADAPRDRSHRARRILLLKLGAIGDVVYTLPLLHRLRLGMPDAAIAWAVEERALPIVDEHPLLDEVILLRRSRGLLPFVSLVRRLRARRFDAVLDLQRLLKSGLLALLSGAPRRLGFDRARSKELSHLLSNEKLSPSPTPRHMVLQYLEFADLLGLPPCEVSFPLPPRIRDAEPREIADVVVGVGAGKPANRWPAESWAGLLDACHARGLTTVITGSGPWDAWTAACLRGLSRAPYRDLVSQTTIEGTAGLIRGARVYVGLDSGITHLASAMGAMVVAVYGAADERRTGPWGPRARIVRQRPSCSPCGKRHCPLETRACMSAITVERVMQEVEAALRDARPPAGASPRASHT